MFVSVCSCVCSCVLCPFYVRVHDYVHVRERARGGETCSDVRSALCGSNTTFIGTV